MKFLSILLLLPLLCAYGSDEKDTVTKIGRLLVNIESKASFSSEEFAREANGQLLEINDRNPFIALDDIYLESPYVVLSVPVSSKQLTALSQRYGYRYISFAEEPLKQAVIKADSLRKNIPTKSSEITPLSCEDSAAIYELMMKADAVFTENNLTYWATAGTLLGAIRHQELIPWDDDLDICILDRDEDKLKELAGALNQVGLDLYYYEKLAMYKITPLNGLPIENVDEPGTLMPFRFPYLDVFVMMPEWGREYEDVYVHKAAGFYKYFNKEKFRYSQIEGIHRAPFGPLSISIPGDPEEFLNANYGTHSYPDLWREYAIEPCWNHKLDTYVVGGTALVELK